MIKCRTIYCFRILSYYSHEPHLSGEASEASELSEASEASEEERVPDKFIKEGLQHGRDGRGGAPRQGLLRALRAHEGGRQRRLREQEDRDGKGGAIISRRSTNGNMRQGVTADGEINSRKTARN